MLSKSHKSYWNGISAILMDTNEEKHLKVDIILESIADVGLSDNEKPNITEIWQHPSEGIITFKVYGSDDEFDLSEYPEYHEQIYNALTNV